jgi:hypothetical protein
LQEEFTEARENSLKYLMKEGITQMTRQHLGVRLDSQEVKAKKKSKIKISIPFAF